MLGTGLSRRGRPSDNAKAERFFKTFKYEEVYLREYDSVKDARTNIQHFIERVYNAKNLYQNLAKRLDMRRIMAM